MIVSCAEMKQIEERVFANGVAAGMLMEDAGEQIAAAVQQFHARPSTCLAFAGRGHNGGDALVAGRHLARSGWEVQAEMISEPGDCSELTQRMRREFMPLASKRTISRPAVVLDGLLGIGAHGPLREPILRAARQINRLRRESGSSIFAIDIPTGVDGDSGEVQPDAVAADFTLTIGFPKAGLLADAATAHVGRLAVLPLRELTRPAALSQPSARVMTAQDVAALLPRRRFDVHKGDFGKIGIIAGSRGLTGAAVMCANACVRAGAGLVTLYVTEDIHPIVAAAVSAEVMARPVRSYLEVLENDLDVLALGPGLGEKRRDEVLEIIARAEQPLILDADAVNIIARSPGAMHGCAAPRLLTPHPGEMKRLDPGAANLSRRETAEKFVARFPHTLLLKGSRTIVGERGKPMSYNSTGSPGMASGGMGDVLTGVCAALAGHGLSLYDAACAGAWLCGRAAELAITHGNESEESLAAMRLIEWVGRAFRDARGGCY